MNVLCPKGHTFIENSDPILNEPRKDVNIFANICDSSDLCRDEKCEYFDLSPEGDLKFQEASTLSLTSLEEQQKDEQRAKAFNQKHNMEEVGFNMIPYLKAIAKFNPEMPQEFLDDYCKANNLPSQKFNGDFEDLQDKMTEKNLRVVLPENLKHLLDRPPI